MPSENGRGCTKNKKKKNKIVSSLVGYGRKAFPWLFTKKTYFWKRIKISDESNRRIFLIDDIDFLFINFLIEISVSSCFGHSPRDHPGLQQISFQPKEK